MNNWFISNRDLIKNLCVNTGTSLSPTWTQICTASEIAIDTDLEEKDFYVFCDAIKRSILTGVKLTINATVKIDMSNSAVTGILGDLQALIEDGAIGQFNNVLTQFELLDDVSGGILTYVKYQVPVVMKVTSLGGAAEDEGEFALELVINGKGTKVTSA